MKTVRAHKNKFLLLASTLAALANSGCGKQAFFVSLSQEQQKAPGAFIVAPKVDIMLVQDDTGSMINDYAQVSTQVPAFLSNLDAQGWNYHFTSTSLTQVAPITQALASHYDGNWGAAWQPPYPGASQNDPGNLAASVFTLPNQFNWAVSPNNGGSGVENGLDTIFQNLTSSVAGTNFVRPDALLVVLMMGNGDDRSKVNLCYRQDGGVVGPCENYGVPVCQTAFPANYNPTIFSYPYTGACGNKASSDAAYLAAYKNLKGLGNQAQVRFFADVVGKNSSCYTSSTEGARYEMISQALSGTSFNLCTQQLSDVLASIQSNLTVTKINFHTHYLFIAQQPDTTTIQVTRYVGGDPNQPVVIPQDPTNGWTYAGYQTNVYAIDYPVPMDLATGFAIQLNGTAELVGDDTAVVTYKPYGVSDSAK